MSYYLNSTSWSSRICALVLGILSFLTTSPIFAQQRILGPGNVYQGQRAVFTLSCVIPSGYTAFDHAEWTYTDGTTTTVKRESNDLTMEITYTKNVCSDKITANVYFYKYEEGFKKVSPAYKATGFDRYGRPIEGMEYVIPCLTTPGPIVGPATITTGDQSYVTYHLSSDGGNTYARVGSFYWTFPATWSVIGSRTESSITLQPDASSGGVISVSTTGPPGTNYSVVSTPFSVSRGAPVCGVTDLYVQNNSSLSGTKSAGKDLFVGRAVTSGQSNGDVVVRSGYTATLVARGNIILEDGFAAEQGSTFSTIQNSTVCTSNFQGDNPEAALASASVTSLEEKPLLISPNPKAATQKKSIGDIILYPNPARQEMHIILPESSNAHELRIYDKYGLEVKRVTTSTAQITLDVTNLSAGIYHLQDISSAGVYKTSFQVE